jgi:hypothetical protein
MPAGRTQKTRRLYDYEVISNLVQIRISQSDHPSRSLLRWALKESFRAEDRVEFSKHLGRRKTETQCRRQVARDIPKWQARDVGYWRPIVRELRELRHRGLLLSQGSLITPGS